MSNYTKSTNFATKDNLTPGDPLKIVRGTEIDTEYNNIATAIATKTDNASAAITGGSITGITDLAVADGGTGASTAAGALNNLLPSQTGNANKYLQTDGTNATWDAVSLSTADITGTLPVANGGTGVTSSTGTGNVVLSNSPTLVTPALGTPSALVGTNITGTASGLTAGNVTTNANLTGAVTSSGNATSLGSFTSAQLLGALSDETGTGSAVFATSPTLVTPILGTPTSATLTNATGLPIATGVSGLGTGVATFLATPSSANLAAALTDETGTGSAVFATSPTLVTPVLGVATGTSFQGIIGNVTPAAGSFTTVDASGSVTLSGGTANGVTYLNGSKVLTSGSALTFDGTNFSTTGSAIVSGSVRIGTTPATGGDIRLPTSGIIAMRNAANSSNRVVLQTNSSDSVLLQEGSVTIDTSGNLGLGVTPSAWTTSFGFKALDIGQGCVLGATSDANLIYNAFFNSSNNWIYKTTAEASRYQQSGAIHAWYNAASGTAGNTVTFNERMRLDASGNLGIGTSSPAQSWTGGSAKVAQLQGGSSQITVFRVNESGGTYGDLQLVSAASAEVGVYNFANGAMRFGTNGTERARIDTSGNLLVGSTSYVYPLSVSRTTTNSRVGYLRADTSSYTDAVLILDTTTTAGTSCRFIEGYSGSSSLQFRVYNNGNVQNTNNSYGSISDAKLKENIVDATPKLADLMQVQVRNYNLIGETTKQIGVVAQELETVFPAMVDESPDRDAEGNDLGTTTKAVKYSVFVPMLIKAIQEQQAIIQSLKARLDAANL